MKTTGMDQRKAVALPRYGEYNCVFKYLLETGLGAKCILPPPITRRTVELGAAASPDTVCMPYKTLLGSMIEALESGAEVLVMSGGLCRLGYFGELQEVTLRDMGYHFEFLNLQPYQGAKIRSLLPEIRRKISPHMKYSAFLRAAVDATKMVEYLDEVTDLYYRTFGFARDRAAFHEIYRQFLKEMYSVTSRSEIETAYKTAVNQMNSAPVNRPEHPLRVGLVGEYYTIMDPPSNLQLEQKLADMGVEVHRWLNLSSIQLKTQAGKNLGVRVGDLARYAVGPNSTENLWCARNWAEMGFDGLIHVKCAHCTPEIDTMPMLQEISREKKIPVLYLTYDVQTSDVGLMTRLEAFYDMIAMRKEMD